MKKKLLAAAGLIGVLVLAGCAGGANSETEQLKQQIAQLEQQVTELENSSAADTADDAASAQTDDAAAPDTAADTSTDAAADTSAQLTRRQRLPQGRQTQPRQAIPAQQRRLPLRN